MKKLLTDALVIICGVILTVLILLFIGVFGYKLNPYGRSFIGSFVLLFILSTPGPFSAGYILKRGGWMIGATITIVTELLLTLVVVWYTLNMFPPSSAYKISLHVVTRQNTLIYMEGGLAVFLGSLAGYLGQKLREKRILFKRN